MDKRLLARKAIRKALRTRLDRGVSLDSPLCAIDFVDAFDDLEVRLVDEPRLEGMYHRGAPCHILLSSHRTLGRQSLTCAHELGHHLFGHGTQWQLYVENMLTSNILSDEEWLVDQFAYNLLMPLEAVKHAFAIRDFDLASPDALDVYRVACQLGVSYRGLVQQLRWSLKLISEPIANQLLAVQPRSFCHSLLGEDTPGVLIVVDSKWHGRAIDAHVGDTIYFDFTLTLTGDIINVSHTTSDMTIAICTRQGISSVSSADGTWSAHIRVSRRFDKNRGYHGLAAYRHWEDPDDVSGTNND